MPGQAPAKNASSTTKEAPAAKPPDRRTRCPAAAWGDDPDYYDEEEAEPGAEYDGDSSAFIAGQDELPTPQDFHAADWATTLTTTTRPT